MTVKHAWNSEQFNAEHGHVIWLDKEGNEVKCSFINDSPDDSGTNWEDAEYLGEVVEWHSSPNADWSDLSFMRGEDSFRNWKFK